MTKDKQQLIYDALAQALTDYMERKNIKPSAVAKMVGEQFNTIRSISEGNVCSLHHIVWLEDLGINVSEVIRNAVKKTGSKRNEAKNLDDLI